MSVLRTGLTLVLGAGVGAGLSGLMRPSEEHLSPDSLLSVCPVLPVPSVQAAELKVPGSGPLVPVPGPGPGPSPGPSSGSTVALMKYGFPSLSNMKTRQSYVAAYDPRTRLPMWVLEKLDSTCISGQSDRRRSEFRADPSVHEFHRATNADFRGSGYDRGHMAAAANHKWNQNAMDETFLLSNVAPQNPELNQRVWNRLEQMCRALTKHYRSVFVCTGPLFLPRPDSDGRLHVTYRVLGQNHVAVPTHFFKVLILELPEGQGVELQSYVMPNRPITEQTPLEHFLVPIETVERASGLLFVQNIQRATKNIRNVLQIKQK
ncbi:endonuclease G, mitochondrial isoform X2 [Eucyclogobius newberryi]|uniref:endonuclease G, mitochondrial isoform X2 n=1 Tax=Eucyclogobius newberryi TaxID=166745 RepID=UPI003B5C1EC6